MGRNDNTLRLKTRVNLKLNTLFFSFVEKVIKLISRFTFRHANMRVTYCCINLVATVFKRHLVKYYSCASALYLARCFFNYQGKDFCKLLIINKLMAEYIKFSLFNSNWIQVKNFLDHNCSFSNPDSKPGKLLLFTHTGDYWLSILTMARQYQGMGCEFIVPIYQPITDEIRKMYNRIKIPGVDVLFINIHDDGSLLKIIRCLKKPKSIVAIFYDLFCYSTGIHNGAVDSVTFFNKKGYMTTGMLSLAEKMKLEINFISNRYSVSEGKYITTISPAVLLSGQTDVDKVIISHLESCIKENAYQWHFMISLDAYFHVPYSQLKLKNDRELAQFARLNYKYIHLND
ncbi:hypothetical protein EHW64_02535 [Erwinia psidii]|uniref:Lipid A biosynthesis lauroyl acyltransferase n=2 Tax=Erwinia psidii TaxID=69224 RepID=A0A3N6SN43_9GAMM|nr:hypothetical protein [Erwinia psidii]MCX8960089.1 hypothetical protein [Erwinia psidii]RQM39156.1 hypothetical protein EB241_05205 [Erwinia psidii]